MEELSIQESYQKYMGMVYKICLMLTKSVMDAEDATQSVFLKRIQHGSFQTPEHEKAWLIVTAQNHCKNLFKNWWRTSRVEQEDLPEPAATMVTADKAVWEELLVLPPKYRIVLYLYYYEGYSTEEVAAILHSKPSTVRTQLCQGRKKLKLILEEDDI